MVCLKRMSRNDWLLKYGHLIILGPILGRGSTYNLHNEFFVLCMQCTPRCSRVRSVPWHHMYKRALLSFAVSTVHGWSEDYITIHDFIQKNSLSLMQKHFWHPQFYTEELALTDAEALLMQDNLLLFYLPHCPACRADRTVLWGNAIAIHTGSSSEDNMGPLGTGLIGPGGARAAPA